MPTTFSVSDLLQPQHRHALIYNNALYDEGVVV